MHEVEKLKAEICKLRREQEGALLRIQDLEERFTNLVDIVDRLRAVALEGRPRDSSEGGDGVGDWIDKNLGEEPEP